MATDEAPTIPGYDVLRRLGSGSSGEVWVVRGPDGIRFAAKLIRAGSESSFAEDDLLRRLDHDHVVRLHDTVLESGGSGRKVLILDLAEGGSLADALAARHTLTPGELVTVLTPIARTLHDLHDIGLVHADISTGNILFTDAGKPMLADLGVSRIAGTYNEFSWATENWAAPEVLAGEAASPASDVYSLGAVAWACVAGGPPPPLIDRRPLAEVAERVDGALVEFIETAMSLDPLDRPSAGDFALRLWQCAPAEPAPVAGSAGARRSGSAAEPSPETLTRRMIRQQRALDEEADTDAEPTLLNRAGEWLKDRRIAPRPALVSAAGTALAVSAVWGVLPSDSAPAIGAVTSPAATTRVLPQPTISATSPVPVAPSATPTPDAQQILRPLVAARAAAWEQENPGLLDAALVHGSAADRRDRAALHSAAGTVDYQGLAFRVTSAKTLSRDATTMSVSAHISRSSYATVVRGTRSVNPAVRQQVRIELTLVAGAWRINDWR